MMFYRMETEAKIVDVAKFGKKKLIFTMYTTS